MNKLNATGAQGMVVDFPAAPKRVECLNVFGEACEVEAPSAGIGRMPVPSSGYAIVSR